MPDGQVKLGSEPCAACRESSNNAHKALVRQQNICSSDCTVWLALVHERSLDARRPSKTGL
jgi:hypothetical protein